MGKNARAFDEDLMRGERVLNPQQSAKRPTFGEMNSTTGPANGTSIFDPVLCEMAYRWFTPRGASILDPFSGGSVRGIVAAVLGRRYTGIDLSAPQIAANKSQWADIKKAALSKTDAPMPVWIFGDSKNIKTVAPGDYDFIFSCPPYANLEQYSDDPADLSTMKYPEFKKSYTGIIQAALSMLRQDRFACFVVGEVRGKDGAYLNFVGDTVNAFITSPGVSLYNEAILLTSVGSLPIRVGSQFTGGRKLGKTHQNVLIFVKGDWRKAAAYCGELGEKEFGSPAEDLQPV